MKEKIKSFFAAIGYLFMAFTIQLVVSIVGGAVVGVIYAINNLNETTVSGPNFEELTNQLSSSVNYILLASSIITVLIFLLIYKVRKKKVSEELQFRKTNNINFILAGIAGLCCWLFNVGMIMIIQEAGLFTKYFDIMEQILAPLSQGSMVMSIITVGIVAPFTEEFLFRGVIYKTLNKNISIGWTIIIQAILFGVFHGNLIQGTYATFLGIVFGYVTYKTKSLWPAIIMHMVNNTVASIVPMFISESIMTTATYIGFIIVGAIGVTIALFFVKIKNISNEDNAINFSDYNNLN